MKSSLAAKCKPVHPYLPWVLTVLFCLQPILDILSYWQDALGISFSLSFVPRTVVLAFLFIGGFVLSERKRYYVMMAGVLGIFFAGHFYACYTNGYVSFVEDTSAFIRVLQLPITTFAMITCLRCNPDSHKGITYGVLGSLAILLVSFVISTATGTEPMTYPDEGVGIRGYSFWPNAQSAILSLSAPITIAWIMKKFHNRTIRDLLIVAAVSFVCLFVLYLHATRLSYACMIMTAAGMAIVVFISREVPKRFGVLMILLALVGVSLLLPWRNYLPFLSSSPSSSASASQSKPNSGALTPVLDNQQKNEEIVKEKSLASERLRELGEAQIRNGVSSVITSQGLVERGDGLEAFALPEPLQTSLFMDVKSKDWNTKHIAYLQTMGLVGAVDTLYNVRPEWKVTLLQAIVILSNVYERYHNVHEFVGYTGDTWYAGYVKKAEAYGLIPDGWDLESYVTREQAAWLIYHTLEPAAFPQSCTDDLPEDVTEELSCYDEVLALYQAGLVMNDPDHELFRGEEDIIRGDFFPMLASALYPEFRTCSDGFEPMQVAMPKIDLDRVDEQTWKDGPMHAVYSHFVNGLLSRFGLHDVLVAYNYTLDTKTLTSEREWKLQFCYLLMDDSTPISRWFGLEVTRMIYQGTSYDVENDFHGIYFLYGWIGLAMMILFLGYFLFLIARALIRDFKTYFTLEAGAIGIALIATLVHAYFTCGVLRRANTLFYFAGLLAAVYYLVVLKQYAPREKKVSKKAKKQKDSSENGSDPA